MNSLNRVVESMRKGLSNEMQTNKRQTANLTVEMNSLTKGMESMRKGLSNEIQTNKQQTANLTEEMNSLTKEMERMRKGLSNEIQTNKQQTANLTEEMNSLTKGMKSMRKGLSNEIQSNKRQTDDLSKGMESMKKGLSNEIQSNKRQTDDLTKKMNSLTRVVESIKRGTSNEIESIKDKISKSPLSETGWNWKFGKSTYYWSKQEGLSKPWKSARIFCQVLGKKSHLVKIETKEENDYLKKQFGGYDSWIGLSDIEKEGEFRWVNGPRVWFSDWFRGEPNDYDKAEDCVHIKNRNWNDASCFMNMYFICEKEN